MWEMRSDDDGGFSAGFVRAGVWVELVVVLYGSVIIAIENHHATTVCETLISIELNCILFQGHLKRRSFGGAQWALK